MHIEMYQDTRQGWRWRATDGNNRIIAEGGEAYVSRDNLERAIDNVVSEFRSDLQVTCRERRSEPRADGIGLYETLIVAEYAAEGSK